MRRGRRRDRTFVMFFSFRYPDAAALTQTDPSVHLTPGLLTGPPRLTPTPGEAPIPGAPGLTPGATPTPGAPAPTPGATPTPDAPAPGRAMHPFGTPADLQ